MEFLLEAVIKMKLEAVVKRYYIGIWRKIIILYYKPGKLANL